jgi:hypothetical protein
LDAEGPVLPHRTHVAFDAWRLLPRELRTRLPADPVTAALLEAISAEEAPRVRISGRLAEEETVRLLEVASEIPEAERARDDGALLVDLEVQRRRAVRAPREEEPWRELFRQAELAARLPGEVGDLGRLYLVASVSGPWSVGWSERELGIVTEGMNTLQPDERFASAFELVANRDDRLVDEETLDRAARLFDGGWPLGPPAGIALHGANQALRLGDPDRAAEWVGRFDAQVVAGCAAGRPDCGASLGTLQQVLGQLAALDDLEPPTQHAAVVQAVVACHEQHPLESGEHSLHLPGSAETPFGRCVRERYGRRDCAEVTLEVGR